MLEDKGRRNYIYGSTIGSTDWASLSKSASLQLKDLPLIYLMTSITISCKSSLMTLQGPAAVLRKLRSLCQAVSKTAAQAKLYKLQQIRMKFKKAMFTFKN